MSHDHRENQRFSRTHAILWALLLAGVLAIGRTSPAWAVEDAENSAPTPWWLDSGQTFAQIQSTLATKTARIEDIKVDSTLSHYTVTYVQNKGTYAKSWWYYVAIDAAQLASALSANDVRLTSLQAYDAGGGKVLFNVSMIANTGADAKGWWYYYNQPAANISTLTQQNRARITTLESYTVNGETLYAFIMIANTGADDKAWWWYENVTPATIGVLLSKNSARLIDFTATGSGTFNAVFEGCSSDCPAWWWWYGISVAQTMTKAQDYGARVFAADPYPGCAGNCLTSLMISNTPADIKACDPQGCISEAALSANICNALNDKVVGYVCLVGGIRPAFGGLARTAANPPETSMTPDLVTDVASVSKTMTATAIMQLLATNQLTPDTLIAPYLYKDWAQGSYIGQLTFRQLLTHTSGFGQISTCAGSFDYASVQILVAGGVVASNIGVPQYGNCNFSLLRELMPALIGQTLMTYANGPARAQQSSALYISHLKKSVFGQASVEDASCTPPSTATGILSYPNPAGSASGTNWGNYALGCGAAGWVLSAFDIFNVVNHLANGTTLLSDSSKQQMFEGCLGWDCSVRPDCPSPYVCKNGAFTAGPAGDPWSTAAPQVWTYAGILKCNVPVVVVVNSALPAPYEPPTGNDIIGLVENAYYASATAGAPAACPIGTGY